jgi:hypothetical protein
MSHGTLILFQQPTIAGTGQPPHALFTAYATHFACTVVGSMNRYGRRKGKVVALHVTIF